MPTESNIYNVDALRSRMIPEVKAIIHRVSKVYNWTTRGGELSDVSAEIIEKMKNKLFLDDMSKSEASTMSQEIRRLNQYIDVCRMVDHIGYMARTKNIDVFGLPLPVNRYSVALIDDQGNVISRAEFEAMPGQIKSIGVRFSDGSWKEFDALRHEVD